jgi:lipopolysaccharide export system permease protein
MRVLDRYIIKAVCGSVALVMTALLALLAVFLFINEQGWVGAGRYGQLQALRFVLLNLPAVAAQFLPVGALIGSLLAMGGLARGSELTVMRAAGVSIARIGLSLVLAGALLVPVAVLLGEYLAPPLVQSARVDKTVERSTNISVTARGGAWMRDGDRILRADGIAGGAAAGGITVFALGERQQLLVVGRSPRVRALADGSWEAEDYAESRFGEGAVESVRKPAEPLQSRASPAFFSVIAGNPSELSLRELSRAITHLAANGQDVRRYRFAYWSTVARWAAIPLAVLLALPFLFGSLRNAESSARAMLGLMLGLGYFIVQRMVESGTIAFALDPLLLAWLPTLLLGAGVAALLARLRHRPAAINAA